MTALRPILLSIPHSSLFVPKELRGMLKIDDKELLRNIDLFTDRLYDLEGYYKVIGTICRICVDVNRAPDDFSKEYDMGHDGVAVNTTYFGNPVYKKPPSEKLMDTIVAAYHTPYHRQIEKLMPKVKFMFDCHSYLPRGPKMKKDAGADRPDFNLGNRRFSTSTREHMVFARDFFKKRNYTVGVNVPYIGGYIIAHHCHRRRVPGTFVPGMQIEINQALYMDHDTLEPLHGNIEEMRALLQEFVDAFYGEFRKSL